MLQDRTNTVRLAGEALAAGGSVDRHGIVEWDVSGNCQNPVFVQLDGYERPNILCERLKGRSRPTQRVELLVRCRKCPSCLRARSKMWEHRARTESACAFRTWFGTLTVRPAERYKVKCQADLYLRKRGHDPRMASKSEWYNALVACIGDELTRYVKRVRKASEGTLRYLLVAEAHKDGFPHFHMLVHENAATGTRHKILSTQWKLGFTQWKVADARACPYVAKYISKEAGTRVRASLNYGHGLSPSESVKNPDHPSRKKVVDYIALYKIKRAASREGILNGLSGERISERIAAGLSEAAPIPENAGYTSKRQQAFAETVERQSAVSTEQATATPVIRAEVANTSQAP